MHKAAVRASPRFLNNHHDWRTVIRLYGCSPTKLFVTSGPSTLLAQVLWLLVGDLRHAGHSRPGSYAKRIWATLLRRARRLSNIEATWNVTASIRA